MDPKSFANTMFLNRFEPNGDDFVFRPQPRAPGIRVTSGERERMIEEYNKRQRIWKWALVV